MDKIMLQDTDKELLYYGVYNTSVDMWDGKDVMCLARKRFFETGIKQKKRSTIKTDVGVYSYSYTIEDAAVLKYKKTKGGHLAERSVESDGGYYIETLDASGKTVKRMYCDKRHSWLRTEYYSPTDHNVYMTISPLTDNDKPALSVKTASGTRILYPFNITFDKEITSELNIISGEPSIFCVTNAGSFYFCGEGEGQKRRALLEELLEKKKNDDALHQKGEGEKPDVTPSFVINAENYMNGEKSFDLKNSREIYIDEQENKPDADGDNESYMESSDENKNVTSDEKTENDDKDFFGKLESIAKQSLEADKANDDKPEKIKKESGANNSSDNETADEQQNTEPDKSISDDKPSSDDKTADEEENTQEAADLTEFSGLKYEKGDIPSVHELSCEFAGECPYETVDKQIIQSGGRQYYYFGELKDNKRIGRGRTVMKNGDTAYEGEYLDDRRDGFGVYYYKTGMLCYTGNWKQNKREGLGVSFSSSDGSVSVGEWKNDSQINVGASFDSSGKMLYAGGISDGKRSGAGVTYNENDKTYFVGKYKDGNFLGTGTQFSFDGELLYTGEYKNNSRSGKGTSYNSDGSVLYKGEWRNNLYNGEGTLCLEDGTTLKGSFRNGRAHGKCTLTDKEGRIIYIGSYIDDVYNGTGRLFYDDGGYAEGRFVDGEPTGVFNEYNCDKKLVYCGEWTDMHRNGRGIEYKNGEKLYEGEFVNSLYNGEGKLYKDGNAFYTGSFKDGRREGFGIEYKNNEMIYKGMWKNDKYNGCGILFEDSEPRFAGIFDDGEMNGRINEISGRSVIKRSLYSHGELTYTCEYSKDGSLVYYGNMSGNLRNGMGCSFIESAEKQFEGIFRNGEPDKAMKVSLRELAELPRCAELENTEYELYRTTPEYIIEKSIAASDSSGIYTGRLKNGKPDGRGTILYSDHRYTGSFADGSPEGEGIVYMNSGEVYKGIFSTKPLADCRTMILADITYYYRGV